MSALNSLCRTCMTNVMDNPDEDVFYYNIFKTEELAAKLMACSNIDIQPNDGYPPNVCNTCCINILDFCDFQDMCRESLEKFDNILEQHATGIRAASSDIGSSMAKEIEEDFADHETILGDHTYSTPKNTVVEVMEIKSESESSNTGGDNHVLVLQSDTRRKIISCDHDYIESGQDVEYCSNEENSDKSDNEQENHVVGKSLGKEVGEDICYDNGLETVDSVEENILQLYIVTNGPDTSIMESDDTKDKDSNSSIAEVECVSLHSETNADLFLFQNKAEHVEPIPDINISVAANGQTTKQLRHAPIKLQKDDLELCETINGPRKGNEKDSSKQHFKYNKEYSKHPAEDNLVNGTLSSFLKNEEEEQFIFVDNAEDEGHIYAAEDEANEEYLFSSPSELEEICSDSDINRPARKLKASIGYLCDLCPQTFILKERLLAHKRVHQGLPGYVCPRHNCTRSFCRLLELRQHIDHDHDKIPRPVYKCDRNNCELKFTSKSGFRIHLRKQHGNGPPVPVRNFVCETCGKSFKSAHKFRIHQYLHVDESLWPFKCDVDGCTKRFRSKENYKVHKYRHDGIKPYACTYCDKTFCTSTNLNAHLNYHTLAKKWLCSFCPKVCYTPGLLRHHIRQKHEANPDTTKYPCRFCDKLLSTQSCRKTHENNHTGQKPYACDECGKRFIRRPTLLVHKQTHAPNSERVKKYRCDICNGEFFTAASMREHKMKHSGEKPFECSTCGVKFRYQSNMLRHQKQNLCKQSKIAAGKRTAVMVTECKVITLGDKKVSSKGKCDQ